MCLLTFSFANAKTEPLSSIQKQNTAALVVSIFGDATPGSWTTDTDMTTTDGVVYTITNVALIPGALKFRGNHSWDLPYDWGGTAFPSGTAVVQASGITIPTTGTYNITFDTSTLAYAINLQAATFQVVSIFGDATPGKWTTDTDMTTTDGVIYSIKNVALIPGALKFRGDHAWVLPYDWGGTDFPSGTAVVAANGIAIPTAGLYNITFNKTTLAYSFTFQVISIFGGGTPGKWDFDTDMTTTDGINYTLNNVALIPGALKFRGDHSWTLPYNWGGTDFPSGTAVIDADGITVPSTGTFNISFNKTTFAYVITNTLGLATFDASSFNVYPNPAQSNWTFSSSKETIESIHLVDITGRTIKTVTPKNSKVTLDASGLTSGIYFAKVTTASGTKTMKVVKQ